MMTPRLPATEHPPMPHVLCPWCAVPAHVTDLEAACERCHYRWPLLAPTAPARNHTRAILAGVVSALLVGTAALVVLLG